jgi:hypothetical protein
VVNFSLHRVRGQQASSSPVFHQLPPPLVDKISIRIMSIGFTLMGCRFEYSGSLATGLVVSLLSTTLRITPEAVKIIRHEVTTRSPVLMGTNRMRLVANSVGETLYKKHGISPQALSYVLPLLIKEGFCTASDRRPFMIHKL